MTVTVVDACRACPFHYVEGSHVNGPTHWCSGSGTTRDMLEPTEYPPDWCPLRANDRLVTLGVK